MELDYIIHPFWINFVFYFLSLIFFTALILEYSRTQNRLIAAIAGTGFFILIALINGPIFYLNSLIHTSESLETSLLTLAGMLFLSAAGGFSA